MLNFVPKRAPSVSLLYGKRPIQRITIGTNKHVVEVPITITNKVCDHVDTSVDYCTGAYNPLPWKEYVRIKLSAEQLVTSDVKTSITDVQWIPNLTKLYAGQVSLVESHIFSSLAQKTQFKMPIHTPP
eukprot:GHVR01152077.1.p1 GENE.GHVR01152077.1~~GHVR01152077.1.p1  ORF type:complete len:128 (-),score=15.09 GHVR01152077.1:134-517(-)